MIGQLTSLLQLLLQLLLLPILLLVLRLLVQAMPRVQETMQRAVEEIEKQLEQMGPVVAENEDAKLVFRLYVDDRPVKPEYKGVVYGDIVYEAYVQPGSKVVVVWESVQPKHWPASDEQRDIFVFVGGSAREVLEGVTLPYSVGVTMPDEEVLVA